MSQTTLEAASNSPASTQIVKSWTITNNAGTDLVMLDAFLSDPVSVDELYQRSLQLLSTNDGQQVIKAGEAKIISLNTEHFGSDGKALDYTIIIARADNLFPIKVVELSLTDDQSRFPDNSITLEDAKRTKQAEKFLQTIIAFPSSEMATSFADVLANPDEQAIQSYFTSYPQYGTITLDMVTAVQTYYNRYGFVWAGYTDNKLYHLYTSDGTTLRNLGSITINNQMVAPVTKPEVPAGFTATYMDKDHRKTTLYYTNGQFSDDINSSSPKICLQGLFILQSQLTGQDTDNKLVAQLYGVLDGTEVFGYSDSDQSINVASLPPSISALFDPKGVWGWLKLSGLIIGAVAALAILAVTARYIFKKIKTGPAPTLEEIRRRARQKAQDAIGRMDPSARQGLRIPNDLTVAIGDVKKTATENLARDSWNKMNNVIDKQARMAEKLLEYGKSSSMDKVMKNVNDAADIVGDYQIDLSADMPGLLDTLRTNNELISKRFKDVVKKLSQSEVDSISAAKYLAEQLTKRIESNEEIREDLMEDEIPEIIEE